MSFNPDRTKQAQEIIFSRKKNATTHPPHFFSNSEMKLSSNQMHLELTLDSELSFNEHITNKIHQANKGFGLYRKLQTILPHIILLTILLAILAFNGLVQSLANLNFSRTLSFLLPLTNVINCTKFQFV